METGKPSFKQKTFPATLVVVFQVLAYAFGAPALRFFYRTKRRLPKNINTLTRGSLLVSNHQSLADPFIITANLPALAFFQLLPIYFPVDHFWMEKPFMKTLLLCLGCYDVGNSRREKMMALFYTHQLLEQKKTVFLFPEGEISKDEVKEFQRGIEYFIHAAINVIFVHMEGFHTHHSALKPRAKKRLVYSEVEALKGKGFNAVSLKQYIEELKKGKENTLLSFTKMSNEYV